MEGEFRRRCVERAAEWEGVDLVPAETPGEVGQAAVADDQRAEVVGLGCVQQRVAAAGGLAGEGGNVGDPGVEGWTVWSVAGNEGEPGSDEVERRGGRGRGGEGSHGARRSHDCQRIVSRLFGRSMWYPAGSWSSGVSAGWAVMTGSVGRSLCQ